MQIKNIWLIFGIILLIDIFLGVASYNKGYEVGLESQPKINSTIPPCVSIGYADVVCGEPAPELTVQEKAIIDNRKQINKLTDQVNTLTKHINLLKDHVIILEQTNEEMKLFIENLYQLPPDVFSDMPKDKEVKL